MYVNSCHSIVFVSFFIKQLALVHLRNKKTIKCISSQSYNLKTIVIMSYLLTATDIKSGKVKEVDMLLPSGYESITEEQFSALFKQIREEMEYLQE